MSEGFRKFVYMIGIVCVIVLVAMLFIQLLPIILGVIAVIYVVNKVRQYIKQKKADDFKRSLDNEHDSMHKFDEDFKGKIIDVDYEDVDDVDENNR
ncbi:hypothetical protein [Clostridium sp. BJN0001]|uniref:hypothetical protein n=1 Tax=Clostridium sp. BJN0001 TaxID=2930219 RepID=UPI001FD05204|nr:hypothetical protein [Clostridium sp. BJN0001]